MKNTKIFSFKKSILPLMALSFGAAALPAAADVACGDVITADTDLTHNLTCPGYDPVLTVSMGAELNLRGKTVNCDDESGVATGILLVDEGSHLRRGKVKNCGTGVQVAGTGTHKVSTIHATENSNGFIVESDDNLLLLNKANNNDLAGFDVRSESNRFLINKANNNAAGFFLLNAPSNDIFWNVASHNDLYGIAIEAGTEFGEDNTVQRNRAFGNGTFDLFDRRIGCGTNIWDHNKFGTANQACIE